MLFSGGERKNHCIFIFAVKEFKYFNVFLLQKGEKMKKNVLFYILALFLLGGGIAQAEEPKAKAGQIEELESITVTSTKTQHTLADVPEETIVITAEELEKQNATNAIDALRWIPGFTNVRLYRQVMNPESFNMDGVGKGDILVLVDGNRTEGSYVISEIPISSIERIEIIKSGNSVLYGSDALAGVINIITKKPTDKVSGSIKMVLTHDREKNPLPTWGRGTYRKNYDTQEANVGFATAALRHQYSARHDYNNYMFESYNVGGKWEIDLNDMMKVNLGLIYATFEEQVFVEDKYSGHIGFDWQGDNSNFKFKSFYRDYKMDQDYGGSTIGESKFYEQELLYSTSFKDSNLLTIGYQNTTELVDEIKNNKKTADYTKRTNSIFLQDEITFFDNLTFVPAVRVHSHHKLNFKNVDPKLSILWKTTDTLKLRLSVGTAYKSPSPEMLYLDTTTTTPGHPTQHKKGNPDLKPETSRSIRLSAEQRLGNFFIGNLALFRTEYNNRIGLQQDLSKSNATNRYYEYVNYDGKTVYQGAELTTKYWLTDNFLLGLGYSWLDTEDKDGKTLRNTIDHRFTPSIRYQDDELGFAAELRGDYELYAPIKGQIKRGRYRPSIYDLNGRDNFILNASVSKQLINGCKVWLNGDNLLKKERANQRKDLVLTLGLECKF